ncbi:MAG TPA: adenylyl-sulfate kinase [Candidatus Paceibacterota bacterium]|nr:adenylyl-sulfate kinase [Candidatus Paceibacterota bacterium]
MKNESRGIVIFLTGLSGAGKSTVADALHRRIFERTGRPVTLLDGDVVRQHLSKGLGFSKEDRNLNIERIGFVAAEVAKHGGIAICAAIAPYASARARVRKMTEAHGTHLEVFIDTPLEECEARDPKGLYKQVRTGLLKGFTGIDDPYERPRRPDIVIDTLTQSPGEAAERIIAHLFIAQA